MSLSVPKSAPYFGFQFSGWRLWLHGLPEECVPRRTKPAVLEVRGQGNSQLSCQKTHKQINRCGIRDSSIYNPVSHGLTTSLTQFIRASESLLMCAVFLSSIAVCVILKQR